MRRNVIFPILGTIALVAVMAVGGYALYQAGYQNGLTETASEVVVRGPRFFAPFGLFFGFIFFIFLFGFIGRMLWGWRGPYRGPWNYEDRSPDDRRLDEWHERAHESGRRYRSNEPDAR